MSGTNFEVHVRFLNRLLSLMARARFYSCDRSSIFNFNTFHLVNIILKCTTDFCQSGDSSLFRYFTKTRLGCGCQNPFSFVVDFIPAYIPNICACIRLIILLYNNLVGFLSSVFLLLLFVLQKFIHGPNQKFTCLPILIYHLI